MAERALPDIKSRLTVDDSDLKRVTANAEAATAKIEASFSAASASTEELTAGLAQVDRSLALTAQESGTAATSMGAYDESLAATTATANRASGAAAEQAAAQSEVTAAYGASAESADVYNASLGGTSAAAGKAVVSLQGTEASLAGVTAGAEAATGAEAALNAELVAQVGVSEASAASTNVARVAAVDYGTVLNNAATTLSGLADAEKAAIDGGVDLGAVMDKTTSSVRAVADVSGQQAAASRLAGIQLAALTAQSHAVGQETAKTAAVSRSFVDRLNEQAKTTGVVGNATVEATNKLKGLGNVLGPAGAIPVGTTAAIVGIAALYIGIKQLSSSVGVYLALADAVRKYQEVTGASAEQASRQVEAFQALGVGADTATGGMVKLSKAIAANPEKLTELGVTIAHTKDGTIDLNGTLDSIIDAWNKSGSAVDRNTLAITAFGKGGAALIPVLAAGTTQLKALQDAAGKVFTQDDLDRARKLEVQGGRLNQQFSDIKANIGGALVPALSAMADKNLENTYVLRQLQKEGDTWIGAQTRLSSLVDDHVAALRRQYRAQADARVEADKLAHSLKDEADRAQEAADAANDLANALDAGADASLNIRGAQLALVRANDDVAQATKDAAAATKIYGARSSEAHDATLNLNESMLHELEAVKRVADGQVALADAHASAAGAALNDKAKHDLLIQDLQIMADQLAPGSPLRKQLDDYINTLRYGIPSDIYTNVNVHYKISTSGAEPARGARQAGGEVIPHQIYEVGEAGRELLTVGDRGGSVVSHGSTMHFEELLADLAEAIKKQSPDILPVVYGPVSPQLKRMMDLDLRERMRRLQLEQR